MTISASVMYSGSFYTNLTDSVMTALSPPSQGGVARLLHFEPGEIYFRARVVIALKKLVPYFVFFNLDIITMRFSIKFNDKLF